MKIMNRMDRINKDNTEKNMIKMIIDKKKDMIKLSMSACIHCSICSDSCFKYTSNRKDPTYTPSYKAINSIGRIYNKNGKLSDEEYLEISDLIWNKCVLCMRCYCPLGINIPSLIATARNICREKGFYRKYDNFEDISGL